MSWICMMAVVMKEMMSMMAMKMETKTLGRPIVWFPMELARQFQFR